MSEVEWQIAPGARPHRVLREPPNTPNRGDRCRRRGVVGARVGVMAKLDPVSNWCTIVWDDGSGMTICHRFELERVDA